jgi:predicted HAD superfamily Cof-like phosphohydrolase
MSRRKYQMSNYDGLRMQTMVTQFHNETGHPVSNNPRRLPLARKLQRCKWAHEEVLELLVADTLVDEVDAIADALYYLIGCAVEMGVDIEKVFSIVHSANMRKVRDRYEFEEDGRTAKPDSWIGPEDEIKAYLKGVMYGTD